MAVLPYTTRERLGRLFEFFRNWGTPNATTDAAQVDIRNERYDRLWDLAVGNAWVDKRRWRKYRQAHGLYRQTRSVLDYAAVAVEFWAARVWAGALAEDGLTLPDGVVNAVPLAKDTDPKLALAVAQVFQWTNFQQIMGMIPRYTAALGESLVEIVDDEDAGDIKWDVIWPGWVKDIDLDTAGNVDMYHLSYRFKDPEDQREHTYERITTKETITTKRDGELYAYDGVDAERDNPWGFCPARWFRHYPMLGNRGEPAIYTALAEMDEINSIMSHLLDRVHTNLAAPIVVTGNLAPNSISRLATVEKRNVTDSYEDDNAGTDDMSVMEAPEGTEIKTVPVQTTETLAAIAEIKESIQRKLPEVQYLVEQRGMTQTTGPGVSGLSVDVDFKYKSICSGSYDRNLAALLQMSIAIGGWRVKMGDWDYTATGKGKGLGKLSEAQKKFDGFDLDSYAAGKLNIVIMPRDLVPQTAVDRMNLLIAKKNAIVLLGTPTGMKTIAVEAGYSEDLADTLATEYDKVQQEAQQKQLELQTVGRPNPNPNSKTTLRRSGGAPAQKGPVGKSNANPRGSVPNKNGRPPVGQGVK